MPFGPGRIPRFPQRLAVISNFGNGRRLDVEVYRAGKDSGTIVVARRRPARGGVISAKETWGNSDRLPRSNHSAYGYEDPGVKEMFDHCARRPRVQNG
jgi:hypothetical protein